MLKTNKDRLFILVIFLVCFIPGEHMIGYSKQPPSNSNLSPFPAAALDQRFVDQIPTLASSASHSCSAGHRSSQERSPFFGYPSVASGFTTAINSRSKARPHAGASSCEATHLGALSPQLLT